jgi:hypothetical protein
MRSSTYQRYKRKAQDARHLESELEALKARYYAYEVPMDFTLKELLCIAELIERSDRSLYLNSALNRIRERVKK